MWFGLTIARSRPASTQWCRKTEFRTARAGCETPKETFETPSDVRTPGIYVVRVDHREVQAGLHAVVQEDRVQDRACGLRDAEGDVRDAERRADAGDLCGSG